MANEQKVKRFEIGLLETEHRQVRLSFFWLILKSREDENGFKNGNSVCAREMATNDDEEDEKI